MKYFLLVWTCVLLLFAMEASAGVRTVEASELSMTPIYLSLGRSTVLRFPEKPRKVVLGNKNYFNIEFIENDVAIQPLGMVPTNLFVYGELRSYGFSLHSGSSGDDLVHVRWALPKAAKASVLSKSVEGRKIGKQVAIGKTLQLRLENFSHLKSQKLHWVEALLLSHEKKAVPLKELEIKVFVGGKEIKSKWVCLSDEIDPLTENSCRLFLPEPISRSYLIKLKFKGNQAALSF